MFFKGFNLVRFFFEVNWNSFIVIIVLLYGWLVNVVLVIKCVINVYMFLDIFKLF